MKMLSVVSMVWWQTLICFSQRRWVAVPIFALGVTSLVVTNIGTSKWGLQAANQWDILLGVFNNQFIVVVLLPVVFWVMVADTVTSDLEGWIYLICGRLPSRAIWWLSKVWAIGVASFVYTGVMFLCVGLVSMLIVPFGWSWSQLVIISNWAYPGGLPMSQFHTPPPVIMLVIFCLIWLGLFALGTTVATLSFIARHTFVGWLVGVVIALVSYGTWMVAPRFASWAPSLQLLLSAHREFNNHVPAHLTLWWSIFIDGLFLTGSLLIGYLITLRRDF